MPTFFTESQNMVLVKGMHYVDLFESNMLVYRPFALTHCVIAKMRTSNIAAAPIMSGSCWSG